MKALHAIRVLSLQARIWAYPYGRNGRIIGQPNANRWWGNPIYHSYEIERSTPPPMNADHWPSRQYWSPWGITLTVEQRITPICGRIRTQSRHPNIEISGRTPVNRCPDCLRLAPDTQVMGVMRAADPWEAVAWTLRDTTVDPVTGL